MRIFRTAVLTALIVCSLSVSARAAETAAVPPAVAPATTAQSPKPADSTPAAAATRLGHVDVERIASESEAAKAGQAQFGELKKKLQGQIDAKRKQLEKLQSSLEAKIK